MTQEIEIIEMTTLMEKVRSLHVSKHRLAQICATALDDKYELLYSFDLKGVLTNFRIYLPIPADGTKPHLQSISGIYAASVQYENEIHDLFGIQVDGMAIDF
ncbi:MAG: NADH-quinone oxidoreductase subunit C, partial [Phycisphaerales bacterium]|nr:NADH-quinone oxidoreductase subunit C [Phycisphaerales bacterium]